MVKNPPKKLKKIPAEKTISENPNIDKRQSDRELFRVTNKFLNVRAMFPKSRIDLRAELTPYQRKKIGKALNEFVELAGGLAYLNNDFVPAVRSAKMRDYQNKVGLPKNSRGVLLGGGSKLKSKVSIKGGALHYLAGEKKIDQYQVPLKATSEKILSASIRKNKNIIQNKNYAVYLGTHGGKINYSKVAAEEEEDEGEGVSATDLFEEAALEIYNKYVVLLAGKLKRDNGRYAAHPNKWGMVLIYEPLHPVLKIKKEHRNGK